MYDHVDDLDAASLGFGSVKIVTVDTDVAILALYYTSKIGLKST